MHTWILPIIPQLSIRDATFTVLPQMSYCGFCAPTTPAMTGPWFNPILSLNRWKDSRFICSKMVINAIANSTRITTLCSCCLSTAAYKCSFNIIWQVLWYLEVTTVVKKGLKVFHRLPSTIIKFWISISIVIRYICLVNSNKNNMIYTYK